MIEKDEIMNEPAISGSPEAHEKIAELWLDIKGYITTTGKWFWVKKKNKKQRGYKDIDVLGVNGEETVILSVSACLDDKIRLNTKRQLNKKLYKEKVKDFFDDAVKYLRNSKEYRWLAKKKIQKKIFYTHSQKKEYVDKLQEIADKDDVKLVSFEKAIGDIKKYINKKKDKKVGKTESSTFKILELLLKKQKTNQKESTQKSLKK